MAMINASKTQGCSSRWKSAVMHRRKHESA